MIRHLPGPRRKSPVGIAMAEPSAHPGRHPSPPRAARILPWVALAAVALLSTLAGTDLRPLAPWPFIVSALLLGMPHGAVDLWLCARQPAGPDWRAASRRFAVYLALLAAMILLIVYRPAATLLLFAAVTAAHFGFADRRDAQLIADACHPDEPDNRLHHADRLAGFGRGLAFLAAAFVLQHAASTTVIVDALALLGLKAAAPTPWSPTLAAAALAIGVLLWLGASLSASRPNTTRLLAVELFELALICLLFATVHITFAIGLYFLAWHSFRHFITLTDAALQHRRPRVGAVAYLHLVSLPLLIPTLAGLAATAAAMRIATPYGGMLLLLISFVVLTPPHHLLVEHMLPRLRRRDGRPNSAHHAFTVPKTRDRPMSHTVSKLSR